MWSCPCFQNAAFTRWMDTKDSAGLPSGVELYLTSEMDGFWWPWNVQRPQGSPQPPKGARNWGQVDRG